MFEDKFSAREYCRCCVCGGGGKQINVSFLKCERLARCTITCRPVGLPKEDNRLVFRVRLCFYYCCCYCCQCLGVKQNKLEAPSGLSGKTWWELVSSWEFQLLSGTSRYIQVLGRNGRHFQTLTGVLGTHFLPYWCCRNFDPFWNALKILLTGQGLDTGSSITISLHSSNLQHFPFFSNALHLVTLLVILRLVIPLSHWSAFKCTTP